MEPTEVLTNFPGQRRWHELLQGIKDKDRDVRRNTAKALGKLGDKRAIGPLIRAIRDEREDWKVLYSAAEALAEIGEPAVKSLIEALKDKKWHVRLFAVRALGAIRDKRSVNALIGALADEEELVGYNAACTLGKIQDKKTIKPLRRLWKEGRVKKSQLGKAYRGIAYVGAAYALARMGDDDAFVFLIRALRDGFSLVRECAADLLGKIGDRRAIGPLIEALKDEADSWQICEAMVKAKGPYDERARLSLWKASAVESRSCDVRNALAEALRKTTGKDFHYDHKNPLSVISEKAIREYEKWWKQWQAKSKDKHLPLSVAAKRK